MFAIERKTHMNDPKLITKFLAWMDLYYKGDNTELLEAHTNKNGERCFQCFVPVLEKQITGTNKNPEKAFDIFFDNFSKELENYLSDKPVIRKELEKQIQALDNKRKEEREKRIASRKESSEFLKLKSDIAQKQFSDDLDMAMCTLTTTLADVSLILNEDLSNLYVKAIGRQFFEDTLSEDQIKMKMTHLCRKEAKESNKLLLFTNCRATENMVLLIGVFEEL